MAIFALAPMPEISGLIPFYKLIINGHCPYDEFCEQIRMDGNLARNLGPMINLMDQVANLRRLPHEKFRDITPKGERHREYEIKRNELRIYMMKFHGHVIVMAGKKGNQKADIQRFRQIKREFLSTKQHSI